MTKREVIGRYRGSVLGILWSFFNPLFMLAVYTFVFSVVFKARWGVGTGQSKTQFAVVLFAGMIVHGLFSEVLNGAPDLIRATPTTSRRLCFRWKRCLPVRMGAALFHSLISLCVLLIAFVILNGYLHWTAVFMPLVLLPLVILTLGLAWMLASLGVFLRDVGQTIGIITMVMLFFSPVFYPISSVPKTFQHVLMLNPLTFIIEQARAVLIWGHLPNFMGLGIIRFWLSRCHGWGCLGPEYPKGASPMSSEIKATAAYAERGKKASRSARAFLRGGGEGRRADRPDRMPCRRMKSPFASATSASATKSTTRREIASRNSLHRACRGWSADLPCYFREFWALEDVSLR